MAAYSIYLGTEDRLALLYSYPNVPDSSASLAATILHWFGLTLQRDGLAAKGARAAVRVGGPDYHPNYYLDLDGPPDVAGSFAEYETRLTQLLNAGWDALTDVIPKIKADGKWDPSPDPEPPPYRPWRFFLPLGMAMINQRSLQFFHYPPIRLLEGFQDYLNDPVPVRWAELLTANGVPAGDLPLHNVVVDATPIAAEDAQGSKTDAQGKPLNLIPIQYFPDYQKALVRLLLNPAATSDYYTIPLVVYGANPKATFQQLFGVKFGPNPSAATAEIIPGRKTAVLSSQHPYVFYAAAQGFPTVGSGRFLSAKDCGGARRAMVKDLAVARWQYLMSEDPSRDPQGALDECTRYWDDPARAREICALVQHQGSLFYSDPATLAFVFKLTLQQGADFCKAHGDDPCAGL